MGAAANAIAAGEIVSWHAMSADEAVKRLATSREKGLDAGEATTRLQKYGPNRLPEGKKRGPFMRLLARFNNRRETGAKPGGRHAEAKIMRKRHGQAI